MASLVNGFSCRTLCQRDRELSASRTATGPKAFIIVDSAGVREATDDAKPSNLSTVDACGLGNPSNHEAMWSGRCAAPDTSHEEPIAADIAAHASVSPRPATRTVASVSALGSTLMVTSVMAASVPHEPASSLHRS